MTLPDAPPELELERRADGTICWEYRQEIREPVLWADGTPVLDWESDDYRTGKLADPPPLTRLLGTFEARIVRTATVGLGECYEVVMRRRDAQGRPVPPEVIANRLTVAEAWADVEAALAEIAAQALGRLTRFA